ncbi:DUF559 domain-containing protein [Antrihabitans sp. YC2-6]|uniref:DUF559 domain-containing protein n=1 Tax=Antrihabitans sp. YC2-6 TaxID=2799498 RepID=UPI0018F6ED1F|nr:DUF559 domain-containing protein [Antrihabitans sp. YC2-6]MBJ8347326.1 DUF559 domain-containing protein [Antrihabitans sp. YC2-6]
MDPFGIRTYPELIASGVPGSTIHDRCNQGIYHRLLPQIYCLGEPTALARCAAITKWVPRAVLSHRTAGWLRGMLPEPAVFEASVPRSTSKRTPSWLKLYRRSLRSELVGECWGMPTVEPARALFDCVSVMPKLEAGRLIDEQLRERVEPCRLLELCELDSGVHGNPDARRQLKQAALHAAYEPERLFARALSERRCPLPANRPVGTFFCDFVDEQSKTIVEIDGREFHSEPEVFRKDRRRQNWIVLEKWLLLRYAAFDVFNELDEIADEAVAVVRRRRRARGA